MKKKAKNGTVVIGFSALLSDVKLIAALRTKKQCATVSETIRYALRKCAEREGIR